MRIIDCQQYDGPWWEARRGVPTCSEFGSIITPAKGEYSKAADTYINRLIAEKFDPYHGMREDYQTAAMRNGSIMEPAARKFYEFERGCKVATVGFVLTDDGRFGGSPDSLIGDYGGLELKCPTPAVHVGYLREGGLPIEYRPQVHGYLVVSGREWWDFMSHCNGFPPVLERVYADDYTRKLAEHLDRFWTEYQAALAKVQARMPEPPPPTVLDLGPLGTEVIPANEVENYW